jgi:hypothetical protein
MKEVFDIEAQENPKDRNKLNKLVTNIFKNKRIVERGFYEIMKDIYEIKESKLYRLDGLTFKGFCPKKLCMEYKTVNGLLKVYEMTKEFPECFSEELIIEYGHRKIKSIAYAIVKFQNDNSERSTVLNRIETLMSKIDSEMSAPRIDEIVKKETDCLK